MDYARGSIPMRSDDTEATIRSSILAAGHNKEILRLEQTNDSDVTIRPQDIATQDLAEFTQSSVPAIDENVKPSRPNLLANKRRSLRRAAIWNSARTSGRKDWKGLDFWKLGSRRSGTDGSGSSDGEELLLASPGRKVTNLPAHPSKSDLDGLAKLIVSIDNERVTTIRHIWHEETHEWTHEKTTGPSSS
jgi:hypothetical protein